MPNPFSTKFWTEHWKSVVTGLAVLAVTVVLVYILRHDLQILSSTSPETGWLQQATDDLRLSVIVLIGFSMTVCLLALLGIIYRIIGVQNPAMPLALPEGSIRALLTFSLVLIFVCLSAFLYSETNTKQCERCGATLERVTESQLNDLKANFIVAPEQAKDSNGKPLFEQIINPKAGKLASTSSSATVREASRISPGSVGVAPHPPSATAKEPDTTDDLKHPLYRVTYYPKPNQAAVDFAKQIFTTIATIFISVVSFYFGSSVTSSAVKAGSDAAQSTDPGKIALSEANKAHVTVMKAQDDLANAEKEGAPGATLDRLKGAIDEAKKNQMEKQRIATPFQKP